jgi:hypothetical protein
MHNAPHNQAKKAGAQDMKSKKNRNYSAQFALASPKAGLSRFGLAGCLTDLGIVHQGVAKQDYARSCLYCATP